MLPLPPSSAPEELFTELQRDEVVVVLPRQVDDREVPVEHRVADEHEQREQQLQARRQKDLPLWEDRVEMVVVGAAEEAARPVVGALVRRLRGRVWCDSFDVFYDFGYN